VFIKAIRAKEPPIEARTDDAHWLRALGREMKEGLAYVLKHPVLRMIAGSTATSNFFSNIAMAVFLVYAVRERDYSAAIIGVIFAIGNVGALIGAFTADRITRAIRLGPAIILGMLVGQIGFLILGVAPTTHAAVYFVLAWVLFGFGGVLYNIDQVSLRQAITPPRLQGRMNASMRFMVWGTMPFGALAGGVLGTVIGLRPTLLLAGVGGMTAVLWLLAPPVRSLVAIPTVVDDDVVVDSGERVHE
jgi:MFS family permease